MHNMHKPCNQILFYIVDCLIVMNP